MKKLIKLIKQNGIRLDSKTVAISGSTGGIGRELCFYLARMGASLIMIDRSTERSLALADGLKKEFPGLNTKHLSLDLEDIRRVGEVACELESIGVDYLILNAGAYSIPRHKCSTGYDNVFQINFVAPYYLARRLLPTVRARGGRIVAVGSIAHRYSHIDINDVDFSGRKKASLVYGNAKRHLMFSLYALDSNTISVTHPGITQTNITAHYPRLIYALIKYPMRVIFMRPRKACLSILCGLFESCRENEWIGPRVFDVWGLPHKSTLRSCNADETATIRARADGIYSSILQ
jgi:NAD(P)-dependent dehydrogenase (short-subunit alcohol dehydrogenase family)